MDSEDADSLSPSETLRDNDDTNSLYSITPSLANELYRFSPVANGDKFQSLNDYYFVPFNEHTRELEELAIEYIQAFNDGKLYREPEDQAGAVEKLLGSQTDEPGRVLDLGCGTRGHWSTSIAAQFPEAEVIGVDLAPSETEFSPPNCSFEVYDVTLGIPFPDDYFSVVHSSYLTPFIPNFAKLVSEVARCLKPGGLYLLHEGEAIIYSGNNQRINYFGLVQEAASGLALPFLNRPFSNFDSLAAQLKQSANEQQVPSFDIVDEVSLSIPIGTQGFMSSKEAKLSSLKQKSFLALWDLLELNPANLVGERAKVLSELREITRKGGERDASREDSSGPSTRWKSIVARKR